MPIETINHYDKTIIFVDYKKCITQNEMIQLLHKAAELIGSYDDTVYTIIDFTDTFFNKEFISLSDHYSASVFFEKVEKAIFIGIDPIKRILLNSKKELLKGVTICETFEQALEKLAPSVINQAS